MHLCLFLQETYRKNKQEINEMVIHMMEGLGRVVRLFCINIFTYFFYIQCLMYSKTYTQKKSNSKPKINTGTFLVAQ